MHNTFKTLTVAALALLMAAQAPAQTGGYKVRIGDKHRDKVRPVAAIGSDTEGNIYTLGMRARLKYIVPLVVFWNYRMGVHPYVKKYDKDMNFIANMPLKGTNGIPNTLADGRVDVVSAMVFAYASMYNVQAHQFRWGKDLYLATPNRAKPNFYLVRVGMDGSMTESRPMLPDATAKSLTSQALKNMAVESNFSPDSNYAAFILKSKKGTAYTSVFDRQMNRLWTSSFTLPSGGGKGSSVSQQIAVNNLGQVYILTTRSAGRNSLGSSTLQQLDGTQRGRPVPMHFEGGTYIEDVKLTMTAENRPAVIGFYRDERKSRTGHDGIIYGAPDTSGNVAIIHRQPFDAATVSSIFTEREKKKLTRRERKGKDVTEDPDFRFIDFTPTADGGALAIAEEQHMNIVTEFVRTGKTTSQRTYYDYYYGDLMIVKLNSQFGIDWVKKAAKNNMFRQSAPGKPYDKNYNSISVAATSYLLFNESAGLGTTRHTRKTRANTGGSGSTYIVSVTPDGTLKHHEVVRSKDIHGYSMDMGRGIYADGNKIYFIAMPNGVFGAMSKRSRIGTITLPAGDGAVTMD